ncbi:curli-like amyloid fiber formation chaperone CsgH [Rhizobium sp. CCGE531]|uniref:curli-like amyloid fiber formation chaperone CsgH n=1 Tax=Rhizobium sp. CCGE531 TaxID=2364271 RepID=UPI0013C4E023|nr:curli-like amyloid fiber formation chaperone CsgH [Rhizobium sp. CCGE531]
MLLKAFFLSILLFSCIVPASSQAGVECLIKTDRKEQFLVVQAIARSEGAVSGRYRLVLVKHSAAGTSQSIQQGNFALRPDSDGLLATTVVDASDQVELTARLLIETDRGTSQCGLPE